MLEWADVIFTMENYHMMWIKRDFPKQYNKEKIRVLKIPDQYYYDSQELKELLKEKLVIFLGEP